MKKQRTFMVFAPHLEALKAYAERNNSTAPKEMQWRLLNKELLAQNMRDMQESAAFAALTCEKGRILVYLTDEQAARVAEICRELGIPRKLIGKIALWDLI